MSIEENQSLLQSIQSSDPEVNIAAVKANQYTEMCKVGQITGAELIELLQDIQRTAAIDQSMNDLESLEKLNIAINALVTIAQAV
jgi:hypothetical protein